MGSPRQPFLYEAMHNKRDDRFPAPKFDPKVVTRASYESKKPKAKPKSPLIAVNRHPEYEWISPCHIPVAATHAFPP